MGTDSPADASNPGSTPAEGDPVLDLTGLPEGPEEVVARYLRAAPPLTMPAEVLIRLQATIAAEAELRRASRVEPDADLADLKPESRLWSDDTVEDV